MRGKVQLCDESKKESSGSCSDTVMAVCIFKDLDRKDLLTCSEKRYRIKSSGQISGHLRMTGGKESEKRV